jgi:hypothetical protein
VETIEELGFGRIEQIPIRDGRPCFERATQTVREIKLGSESEPRTERINADLTLKIEFERLFNELSQLGDGLVDLEIRHAVPFKLVVRRSGKELLP